MTETTESPESKIVEQLRVELTHMREYSNGLMKENTHLKAVIADVKGSAVARIKQAGEVIDNLEVKLKALRGIAMAQVPDGEKQAFVDRHAEYFQVIG